METNDQKLDELSRVDADKLTAAQKAGMQLARSLLWLIAAVIVLYALIYLEHGCGQGRAPTLPGATAIHFSCHSDRPEKQMDVAFDHYQFTLSALLPIFTIVLGYIFGTKSRG